MGINGLIPSLEPLGVPTNIEKYRGGRVAVYIYIYIFKHVSLINIHKPIPYLSSYQAHVLSFTLSHSQIHPQHLPL